MKQIRHPLILTNNLDLYDLKHRRIQPEDVRTVTTDGIIDTGSVILMIPEEIAIDQLGLEQSKTRQARIRDANEGVVSRQIDDDVQVSIMGRDAVFDCVIGPRGSHVLIGQIVLARLDINIESNTGRLYFTEEEMPVATVY